MQALDSLRQLNPQLVGYGSVAAIGLGAFIAFRLARRIVALGYFVLYFFIGFAIVFAASAYATKSFSVPLSMPIVGGLAFAAVASAIRAKLMRIVSAIMMIALFGLAGKYWSQYANERKPGGDKSAQAQQTGIAAHALQSAKSEFSAIAEMLPRDASGKIKAGWIKPEELQGLGVDAKDLKSVKEKPAWHTWLTGLYQEEQTELGVWTDGGTPEQAKKSLKLRQR